MASSLASCAAQLSDAPVRDSAETKAFINNDEFTSRDLETFDTLRGSFVKLYRGVELEIGADTESKAANDQKAEAAVDEFRQKLVDQGSWPQDSNLFSGPSSAHSPQLWVRLGQLSEDYLEQETGEQWRIDNVSYPFPNNGPIPVPPRRDEEDAVVTTLVCERGADKGISARVYYHRWASPAVFTCDIEDARETAKQKRSLLEFLQASPLLEGRTFLLDPSNYVYLWSTGDDDPLRTPEAFTQLLVDLYHETDERVEHVTLLEKDAPVVVTRDYHSDYSNSFPPQLMDTDAMQDAMLGDSQVDGVVATADELYSQRYDTYDTPGPGPLYGYLAEGDGAESLGWETWDEGAVLDADAASLVAQSLGVAEDSLMTFVQSDENPDSSFFGASWAVHAFVPRGSVPETPDELERMVLDVQHDLWRHYFDGGAEDLEQNVAFFLYVVEPESIATPDGPASFADMRTACMADPQAFGTFTYAPALRAYFSTYGSNSDSTKDGWHTDFDVDFSGPLRESREWFLASYGV